MYLTITQTGQTPAAQKFFAIKEQLLTLQFLALSLRDIDATRTLAERVKKEVVAWANYTQEKEKWANGFSQNPLPPHAPESEIDDDIIAILNHEKDSIQLNEQGLAYHCEVMTERGNTVVFREGIDGPPDVLIRHTAFTTAALKCFDREVKALKV